MFANRTFAKFAGAVLAASALGVGGFATAAPASALKDTALDKRFIQMVTDLGIDVTSSNKGDIIAVGYKVCSALDSHASADSIASKLAQQNKLTTEQAQLFVVASETVYCPQHLR
jgi:uncharacterized protein DUF732